jgi:hypothetical protein
MGTENTASRVSSFVDNQPHSNHHHYLNSRFCSHHGPTCNDHTLVMAISQEKSWMVAITKSPLDRHMETIWRVRAIATRKWRSLGEDLYEGQLRSSNGYGATLLSDLCD